MRRVGTILFLIFAAIPLFVAQFAYASPALVLNEAETRLLLQDGQTVGVFVAHVLGIHWCRHRSH